MSFMSLYLKRQRFFCLRLFVFLSKPSAVLSTRFVSRLSPPPSLGPVVLATDTYVSRAR